MAKSLVIVESPTKAKTLAKILGREYQVKASYGHIVDLPYDDLGVDISNGFEPKYVRINGKGKIISELKTAASSAQHILLATDPDREGEAIAHHLAEVVAQKGKNLNRVLFHEITASAVRQALKNPGQIDERKVDAQQARRVLDRLVGYLVSPILWKTVSKGLSAGRVQSVALRMMCERENEIRSFKPEEYWTIDGDFLTLRSEIISAQVVSFKGEKINIADEAAVKLHIETLLRLKYFIKDRREKLVKRAPQPPFTTSTLEQEAAKRLHFTSQKTMHIAQMLYEGIELGEQGLTGLITYMRTDSVRTSPQAVSAVRTYIADTYGIEYVPDKARNFKTKGRAQEAHEAIRPTFIKYEPKKIKKHLTPDQFKLYKLIFERFVASQMKEAIFNQITVEIAGGDYIFKASESENMFRGYLQAMTEVDEDEAKVTQSAKIPKNLAVGEPVELKQLFPEQHFTEPPPRYNESSLIKSLDEQGIGRPSTYATIISTLFERNYIEREDKKLLPTDLGQTVNEILVTNFPEIFNIGFTAKMENRLDDIEAGEAGWRKVVEDFYHPFNHSLQMISGRKEEIKRSLQEKTGEKCEKCGSDMVIRWGRKGKFMACSNFPKCWNSRPLQEEKKSVQLADKKCPECGSNLVLRKSRYGQFWGCSNYPKCKYLEKIKLDVNCPRTDCKGKIVERRSKKGKVFYGCSNYPDCDYVSWYQPVNQKCPQCEHPILELHRSKNGEVLQCPNCKHQMN